ncbi:MAG: HEPN domain-containing protein [Bacteroidota bacterium]|nr:HEPN domain-containing protein [Bacteroidota bacterium]
MDDNSSLLELDKIISHWIESSDDDYSTMIKLFDSKSYSWSLFVGHIVIEKLLKAVFVKKHKKHAPLIHNLYRLAELNEIEMSNEQADMLFQITTFNINTKYDDYKNKFHLKCTKEFTLEWIEKIKTVRLWIKKML